MWIRTSVNQMPENHGIQVGQCWKGLIRPMSEATRLRPTYCLTMSWGMDVPVDTLAAGALDVVDITYSLSRREAKNAGHGSVEEEAYINHNNRI